MDKRKRIIVSVTNDLNYDQRMRRHAGILANEGFEVVLVGRNKTSSEPLSNEVFSQVRLNCHFEKGKLFYLEYNIRLLIYLLSHKADIFIAVDLDTLLPNTLAAIVHQSKLVFDSHEYFTEVPELIDRPNIKLIWDGIARVCIPYTHLCYTVGAALAKELSNKYQKNFEVIRNVPPLNNEALLKEKNSPLIIYQGALNKGRALEPLILAMKKFEGQLLLVGEGDSSEALRLLVQTENLENKVQFAGWIKPADLPKLTQQAWCGYNLLEEESRSYYFSLANKFFDYIHAEIPQLCPPFPEYIEINQDFEVALICEANEEDILSALNKLLKNSELYNNLKKNCSLAAKAYNLQEESIKLLTLYRAI